MSAIHEDRTFRILIVEDDAVNIGVISNSLSSRYQLFIAKTRLRALEILKKKHIDIVLLDVNLPDGNGFDICKEIIDNKSVYGDLSVVFMTGMDSPEDEARGIRLGARDYITKPINSTVLNARVELQAQLTRQTELLSNLARIDGTTEVSNRRAFDDQLQIEWKRALRDKLPLSLCILDIDFFKQFNDTYGHPAGDQCLKSLAKCLVGNLKRSSDFVARYGGEEFVALLYKADSTIAERLIQNCLQSFMELEIPHEKSTVSKWVTFSAGICTAVPTEDLSPAMLLENADQALYQAKENGRAQIRLGEL